MKLSKLFIGIAAAGMVSVFTVPAQADVIDAWKMVDNGTTYSNIGFLDLTAGPTTVYQEINGSGNVFVGAKFQESAQVFTISYTPNTVVGPNDTGFPVTISPATNQLTITVNPASGAVTGVSGGFTFSFNTGPANDIVMSDQTPQNVLMATVSGVGGNFNQISGFAGGNGATTIDGNLIALLNGFQLLDSTGAALDLSALELEATTNNLVGAGSVGAPTACPFATAVAGDLCVPIQVSSSGQLYLRTVPEPATLALLGLGLVGLGIGRRRATAA